METCSNCHASPRPKKGGTPYAMSDAERELVHLYYPDQHNYCASCGPDSIRKAHAHLSQEITSLTREIIPEMSFLPVVTSHSPLKWDYTTIRMVTAQAVVGTGPLTEVTAGFADLFGVQSQRYNAKLKNGEQSCLTQIRKQALDLQANAILATQITYNVVSTDAMVLVCVAGTAVRLANPEVLGEARAQRLIQLSESYNQLTELYRVLRGINQG